MDNKPIKQRIINTFLLLLIFAFFSILVVVILSQLDIGISFNINSNDLQTFFLNYGIWVLKICFGVIIWSLIKDRALLSISIGALSALQPHYGVLFYFLTVVNDNWATQRDAIAKYALLLSFFYILEIVFQTVIGRISNTIEWYRYIIYLTLSVYMFSFLLNLVTAIIMQRDAKKWDVNARYIFIATLLFRSVGVVVLLLFLVLKRETHKVIASD
jgi:hypothetical protein